MEIDAERRRVVMGWGTTALWTVAAAGAAALLFVTLGPERVWSAFGPADLGDVTFETLVRRTSPNDALAAPEGLGSASREITPPTYSVPALKLREAFHRAIAGETRLTQVAVDDASLTQRYVQRTPLLGYPDTIVVRFIPLGDKQSTIALYSRSMLGRSDLGANRARLERWIGRLAKEVA